MRRRIVTALIASGAFLVSRNGAADPPAPARHVIVLSDLTILDRPSRYATTHRRTIEGARRALTSCHEIALAEDPKTVAQVDAAIKIGPNGEVMSVTLDAHGPVADVALACFKRKLVALIFDPPGAVGALLRVALVLGEPRAAQRPQLPFTVDADATMLVVGPIPMRLGAQPPPPAFRAVRATTRLLESCVATNRPATTAPAAAAAVLDVRLLVTSAGDVARLVVTSDAKDAAPIVSCAMQATWPEPRGRLAHVDVRLSVAADGKVSVAP